MPQQPEHLITTRVPTRVTLRPNDRLLVRIHGTACWEVRQYTGPEAYEVILARASMRDAIAWCHQNEYRAIVLDTVGHEVPGAIIEQARRRQSA